jgi:hypothetical protein
MEASGTSGKRGGLGNSTPSSSSSSSSSLLFVGCVLSVGGIVAPLVSEKRVREKWRAKREAMRRMKRRERGPKSVCDGMVRKNVVPDPTPMSSVLEIPHEERDQCHFIAD